MKCGFGIGYGIGRKYQPIWVSFSDPKWPINQFKPVQQSKQQVLRAYCHDVYTVSQTLYWSTVSVHCIMYVFSMQKLQIHLNERLMNSSHISLIHPAIMHISYYTSLIIKKFVFFIGHQKLSIKTKTKKQGNYFQSRKSQNCSWLL